MQHLNLINSDKRVKVDNDTYNWAKNYNWILDGSTKNYVVTTSRDFETRRLHRIIMDNPEGLEVDHINGNVLDNRKENLRVCTPDENKRNRKMNGNTGSPYKGITFHQTGKWQAQIRFKNKLRYLGLHETPESAAKAYDQAAIKYFGEFANINGI